MAADAKRKALAYLGLALLATLLIGAGLSRLEFQPGMPLPRLDQNQVILEPTDTTPPVGLPISAFMEILLALILAVSLIILIYRLIKGVNWKQVLSELLSFVWKLLLVLLLLFLVLSLLPRSAGPSIAMPLPIPRPIETSPLGPVPPILIWLVGAALLVATVLTGIWALRSRRGGAPEGWELGAEDARRALLAGGDLKEVIPRCYQQMSRALQQEQEIERESFMTTGEFERILAAKGVPYDPVHQLTLLFDAVRYGHWRPDSGAEQRALSSLDAILVYSRGTRQEG